MNQTTSQHGKPIPETVPGITYAYVGLDNAHMKAAYDYAKSLYNIHQWNKMTSPAIALVKNDTVLVTANAGDEWHQRSGSCERVRLQLPAGVGYDQCPGCHPNNHSEKVAVRKAQEKGIDLSGASAYLYGHWWYCASCLQALIDAGVTSFYMLDNADILFDRNDPGTVIGKPEQFAH
jgi:deoxycytidylate deaminase